MVATRVIAAVEHPVRVGYRYAVPVRVNTGQCCHDVVGSVRDQRGVMITADRSMIEHEVEQVWHLLEI